MSKIASDLRAKLLCESKQSFRQLHAPERIKIVSHEIRCHESKSQTSGFSRTDDWSKENHVSQANLDCVIAFSLTVLQEGPFICLTRTETCVDLQWKQRGSGRSERGELSSVCCCTVLYWLAGCESCKQPADGQHCHRGRSSMYLLDTQQLRPGFHLQVGGFC